MWQKIKQDPLFPYFFPFFVYALIRSAESLHPLARYVVYPLATIATGYAIAFIWKRLPPFHFTNPIASTILGLSVFLLWVTLDPFLVHRDESRGFNPFQFHSNGWAWSLAAFRWTGASLMVPIMEELFWRGFLMRFLIHSQFERLSLGQYRPFSFFVTTACFAAVHGVEWPLAVIAGLLYGSWFVQTKSLGNVIWAHGITNFLLGGYVLLKDRWYFW